jgi:hypothetical protein
MPWPLASQSSLFLASSLFDFKNPIFFLVANSKESGVAGIGAREQGCAPCVTPQSLWSVMFHFPTLIIKLVITITFERPLLAVNVVHASISRW